MTGKFFYAKNKTSLAISVSAKQLCKNKAVFFILNYIMEKKMSETLEIGSIKPRIRYEGDGSTTEFNFTFTIFDETDVDIYAEDTLLTEGYTIQKEEQGGKVIFDTAPTSGTIITIYRNLELKRTTNFQEVGPFRTSKVNLEFDYQLACMEQLQDLISRTVTFPPYAPTQLNVALPMPEAGKAIIWNANENSLQNSTIEIEKLTNCYSDVMQKATEVQNNTKKTETACAQTLIAANQAAENAQYVQNRPETIYTSQKDLGTTEGDFTVTIEPGIFEYIVTPTGNTDFNFDFSKCNTDMIISFSLLLNQNAGDYTYSYTFPETETFQWLDGLSATPSGSYLMTFRRYPDGRILGVANGVIAS